MLSNSIIRIQSIYKIGFIAVICFSSINIQGSVPNVVNNEKNQVSFQESNLNSGDNIKPNFADTDNLKDDDLCQDNIKAEESLENKNLEVSDNLYSRLRNSFFFIKTKLWDFCDVLLDVFFPADYWPTSIGEFFAGYIPVTFDLYSCFNPNPQGDLKEILEGTGIIHALHYCFFKYYYRIMPTTIGEFFYDFFPFTFDLYACFNSDLRGDLKTSLGWAGIRYALHYCCSRYYYRKIEQIKYNKDED